MSILKKLKRLWTRFSPEQFQCEYVRPNLYCLKTLKSDEHLSADKKGKLKVQNKTFKETLLNFLCFFGPSFRVSQVIEYTLIAYLYEIRDPLNKQKILTILEKKRGIVEGILKNLELLEERKFSLKRSRALLRRFVVQSYVRLNVIKKADLATRRRGKLKVFDEINAALKMGVLPKLTIKGLSGVYIMRGREYQPLGVFKPFDEEIRAPNNPSGINYRGVLGERSVRSGIRVGECLHREVAAYYVDRFLSLNMVPKTYYARFTHSFFGGLKKARVVKEKWGSFQEFLEGFSVLSKWKKEDLLTIPVEEVQKIFILDLIIGHLDRHFSNILFNREKVVAIDNGLSFSDREEGLDVLHWKHLPQCKEALKSSSRDLIEKIDADELAEFLHKKCELPQEALEKMKNRIAFLKEEMNKKSTPFQVAEKMMSDK